MKVLLIALAFVYIHLISLNPVVLGGYLLDGGSTPECWVTDLTTKIQIYQSTGCPSTIFLNYTIPAPSTIYEGTSYPVTYVLTTTLPVIYDSKTSSLITHANIHSCKSSMGACVPNVAVTPGLVTQTPAITANGTITNGTLTSTMNADLQLFEGKWVALAHVRLLTATHQYDIACATFKTVLPVIITTVLDIPDSTRSGFMAFSAITALVCLIGTICVIMNRDRKVIKYATSSFCIIMMVGATIGSLSPIPYSEVSSTTCMIQPIMPMFAFTLFFVPIVLKTVRVYRLFNTTNFKKVTITDNQLLLQLLAFIAIDAILISIWMGNLQTRPIPARISVKGSISNFVDICTAPSSDTYFTIVVVFKAAILFSGTILAYLTRKVPSLFNESKYIVQCQYILALFIILGIPLIRLVKGQPDIIFAVTTIVMSFSSVTIATVFFAPKFWILYTVDDSQLQAFKSSEEALKKEVQQVRKTSVVSSHYEASEYLPNNKSSDLESGSITGKQNTNKPSNNNSGNLPSTVLNSIKSNHAKCSAILDRNAIGFIVKPDELEELLDIVVEVQTSIQKFVKRAAIDVSSVHEEGKIPE